MMKTKRIAIILGLSFSVAAITAGVSFTFAAFSATDKADQMIGYKGLREKSILLETYNGGTWSQSSTNWDFQLGQDTFATYYMYAFNHSDPGKYSWIVGTIVSPSSTSVLHNHHIVAFQFDSLVYDRFDFIRFNPNGANVPSWDRESGSLWDQTSTQTWDGTTNYYAINTQNRITNGDGYGHDTASIRRTATASVDNGVIVLSNIHDY